MQKSKLTGQHTRRNRASKLASSDTRWSAEIAKSITDPWHACQAYSWAARYADEHDRSRLLKTAFEKARQGKDAYQQLAVASWPLRVLIETDKSDEASLCFRALRHLAPDVRPPSSRGEACLLVFQAVAVGPPALAMDAFRWLVSSNEPIENWRQRRAILDASLQMLTLELVSAATLEVVVSDQALAASILQRFERGSRMQPRAFFWKRD